MARNRTATILFIGILICVPLLALYQFGIFVEAARWLNQKLPLYLVLPEAGVRQSLLLQYAFYSVLAFTSAWLGMDLPRVWQKYLYLLVLSFLTCLLTPFLAFNGILFEPFSGILAAWFAGLLGIMLSDQDRSSQPLAETSEAVSATPEIVAKDDEPVVEPEVLEPKPEVSPEVISEPTKKGRKHRS